MLTDVGAAAAIVDSISKACSTIDFGVGQESVYDVSLGKRKPPLLLGVRCRTERQM
jgi:hypothetical protein